MKIAIASDHGGIELKSVLINHLQERTIEVIDCGTYTRHAGKYSREMLI